jgi:hypothetical protein
MGPQGRMKPVKRIKKEQAWIASRVTLRMLLSESRSVKTGSLHFALWQKRGLLKLTK